MTYPYANSIVVHNKKIFVKLYTTHYVKAKIAHKNKIADKQLQISLMQNICTCKKSE